MKSITTRLLPGAAGASALAGMLVFLNWPAWLSVLVAGSLYLVARLAVAVSRAPDPSRVKARSGGQLAEMARQVRRDQKRIAELKRLSGYVDNPRIRTQVADICDLAAKIFHNFRQDPNDLRRAHRFLSQFGKVLPIVDGYVHLSTDPDRRGALSDKDERLIEETLADVSENLRSAYREFQENNIRDLRMAAGTLKRMIEMDHTIRRGRG
jgi:hypothetical protein